MRAAGRRVRTLVRAAGQLASRRRASPGGVVLAYHDVAAPGERTAGYTVDASLLSRHVAVLRRLGLEVVELRQLVDALVAGRPTHRMAAITFDDALVGVVRYAAPVLASDSTPATVFAVTSALGASPPWWPGSARTMTAAELSLVGELGLDVGAHTRTHASLPALDAARLADELEGCRRDLAELVPAPLGVLAYPFGHHDPVVRAAAAAAGFSAAFTFLNGRVSPDLDRFRLPRLTMGADVSPARLALWLGRRASGWTEHQAAVVLEGGPASGLA